MNTSIACRYVYVVFWNTRMWMPCSVWLAVWHPVATFHGGIIQRALDSFQLDDYSVWICRAYFTTLDFHVFVHLRHAIRGAWSHFVYIRSCTLSGMAFHRLSGQWHGSRHCSFSSCTSAPSFSRFFLGRTTFLFLIFPLPLASPPPLPGRPRAS